MDGSEPAWADDLNLLFASDADTADGQHDILTVRADGSNADQPSPVIAGPGDQRSPDLSPDGTKIAYVGRATGEAGPGLYIAAADGTDAKRLSPASLQGIDQPEFSATDNRIAFSATRANPQDPHGEFAEAISLNVPRAPVESWDVRAESLLQAEINRERLAAPHVGPPWRYPLYPEPGGLIAWADGADGFPLYWLPQGPPEAWPTVIENFEDLSMREYAMPCVEVLLALLEERLDIPTFTYIPPELRYVFEPLPRNCKTSGSSPPLLDAVLWPARTASRGVQSLVRRSRDLLDG